MLRTCSLRNRGYQKARLLLMRTCRQSFLVICLIPIALALSIAPATASKTSASEKNKIIVGGEVDYPPYSFLDKNGEPTGFQVELTRAIAKTMGINIEIRLSPWPEARKALEDGSIDIIPGMFYSEDRAKNFDFSPPFSIVSVAIFVRINSPSVQSIEDLRNKEIIVMRGEAMHDYILKHRLTDRILLTETPGDALRLLASGKGDYALVAQMPGFYWIKELKLSNVTSVGPSLEPFKNCFAVRKGNALLLSRFTEGLNILNQTGEYSKLYEKWLGVMEPTRIRSGLIFKYAAMVFVPLILLLAVSLLWSWMLRSKVNQKTKELQESEGRFRSLVSNIPGIVYRCANDSNWTMLFISSEIDIISDYPASDFINNAVRSYASIIHPEDRDLVDRAVQKGVKEKAAYSMEYRICRADGSIRWVHEKGQGVFGPNGNLLWLDGVILDITDQMRAEAALRESENRLREITTHIPGVVYQFYVRPSGAMGFYYVSERSDPVIGLKPDLDGYFERFSAIVIPEHRDGFIKSIEKSVKESSEWKYEGMLKKPSGEIIWFSGNSTPSRRENEVVFNGIVRDITAEKRDEEALQESENRYRNIFDNAIEGIFQTTPEGRYRSINPSFARMFGYESAEEMKSAIRNIGEQLYVNPEDRKRLMEMIQVSKGMVREFEVQLRRKDGSVFLVSINARMGNDEIGKSPYLEGTCIDITDRKQAEEALQASQDLEKSILLSVPHALFGVEKRLIFFANDSMEDVFGWKPEELIGKSTRVIFRNDHEWKEYGAMLYSKLGMQPVFVFESEVPFVRKDGREIFCRMSVSRTGEALGESRRIVATFEDITERRRAEMELRETQRRLMDIIEFLPDATLVIDRNGKVIAWNRAIEAMTGVRSEEILGKGDYEYALPFYGERKPILIDLALHPDPEKEKAYTTYTTIQRMGDIIIGEAYTPALMPGNVHLSATASVLRDSRGEIIAAIECIRNNTDRKNMEERLRRAEKMEALGVLAGGVAHDMNNVLGVLVGYSELLLREVQEGSRAGKYAKSILQGGERAAAIIQDLLTMARRGVSVSEAINMNQIVADSFKTPEFELVKSRHPEILFRSQVEKDLLNVKGSPVHISKTIMNLLSNAAESISGAGEVTITTENRYVDLSIPGYENTQEGEYVVLTVSDTGSGISPADLGRIFEPFYTKKAMGRSGTGLGLAVVWGTMKDHGGYIDVRSEESKGSIFTLYFPATRESLPKGGQYLSPDVYSGQGESILVVDDIEEQRLLAATILEDLNYRVATAASGEDAVEYLRANKADLIVLDMIMEPGIDGLETYRRILEILPKQKAIIVSGFAKTDRVGAAQELGAGEYVKKPYVIEKLGIAVRKELDRK